MDTHEEMFSKWYEKKTQGLGDMVERLEKNSMFILKGHELVAVTDPIEWGKWMETANRGVCHTYITPKVAVSTVFIGMNMNFGREGSPILFESMVFGFHPWNEEVMGRYSTWRGAELGHEETVRKIDRTLWQYMRKNKKRIERLRKQKHAWLPFSSMYNQIEREDIKNAKEEKQVQG